MIYRYTKNSASVLLIILLLACTDSKAQNADNADAEITFRGSIGVSGAFGPNTHSASFKGLPTVPSCCPQYATGSGTGLTFGGLFETPLMTNLSLEVRGLFTTNNGTFTASETKLIFDGKNSVDGLFEHTITTNLSSIGVLPSLRIPLIGALNASAGMNIAFIMGSAYTQQERLVSPGDMMFENDSRTRLNSEGSIAQIRALQMGFTGGISYDVPLNYNATLLATPELSYTYGLTDILQNDKWKVHSLRFGIALKYAWYKFPELIEPTIDPPAMAEPEIQTFAALKPPSISGSIHGRLMDRMGKIVPGHVLEVKNITSTYSSALVNYVFFDDTSAVLPARYVQLPQAQTEYFTLKDLEGTGTLQIYYNILNIVAKRMQLYPEITITVTGCTSGGESEKALPMLSRQRAEVVRNYLVDIWKIDPKRIEMKYRGAPEVASNIKNAEGLSENRRVEITSKSWELFDVVTFNDTVRQLSVPMISIEAEAKSESAIESWRVTASQEKVLLKEFRGTGDVPKDKLRWNFVVEPQTIPRLSLPISFTLDITDYEGSTRVVKSDAVKIKQLYDQKERIETFSLITFGFNQSSVDESNMRIINLIKTHIAKNSIVTVTGLSDRIGDVDYNFKLSERRAKEIGRLLGVPDEKSSGLGGSNLLYDNDLPEGRFYSRTVRVVIETPIQ